MADLRGNGKFDVITANTGGASVSVLLGNGDGTFQAHRDYPVNGGAYQLVVGDFNGDGKPDIAVATSNGLSILLGNGDGTFQGAMNINTGTVYYVAAGDLTGDGHLDLAVAKFFTNQVGVLLGNGDGTFQAPVYYPTNGGPHSVVIGDFNGDGTPDLAVSTQSGSTADVFLGRGDGTFRDALHFTTGAGPNSIVAGDFANNGRVDLATANFFASTVSVLLNDSVWPSFDTFALSGPTQATAGDTVALTLSANLNGAIDAGYTGTVHFSSTDVRAGLPADYTFTPDDQGTHTFDVVLRTAGNQSITAAETGGGFASAPPPSPSALRPPAPSLSPACLAASPPAHFSSSPCGQWTPTATPPPTTPGR